MSQSFDPYFYVPGEGRYDYPKVTTAPRVQRSVPETEEGHVQGQTYGRRSLAGSFRDTQNLAPRTQGGVFQAPRSRQFSGPYSHGYQHSSPAVAARGPRQQYASVYSHRAPSAVPLSFHGVLHATNEDSGTTRAGSSLAPIEEKRSSSIREGTPSSSPLNLAFPQITDILPPLSLFDESTSRIRKLASLSTKNHLPQDEQFRRLAEIITPGTNAISISRIEALLEWPALQGAWATFQKDVLERNGQAHAPAGGQPDRTRFSTMLNLPQGTRSLTLPTATKTPPQRWRHVNRKPTTALATAATNIRQFLTITPTSINNDGDHDDGADGEEDLGLPTDHPLLAHRLRAGLNQSRPANLATTCPVNTTILSQWTTANRNNRNPNKSQTGRQCTIVVEDHYAQFVLACLAAVYPPPSSSSSHHRQGDDEQQQRWREKMGWLRDGNEVRGGVKDQMWILLNVLFFLHCEKRKEIWVAERKKRKGFVGGLFCWSS
ncbi:hypothetical protein C8A00DRAFT_33674 [Chaetomidium leptoderma]|uniref:Uncharacterized protein n=1 Tax=Chaetomidium leptoderma TaxID=669021 RepID=A0AAN6VL49_9PEZI|nr:hypothetical protein C8A00DRAFT_33674 [Chaetomidium leptoderma]